MNKEKLRIGWILYIVECADKTLFTGMTRDLTKALVEINVLKKRRYFNGHPERIPVKVVFQENNVPFREAYSKFSYLRKMNRYLKNKLIRTKKWPVGGPWKEYMAENY
jgi:putative endonuclease